jgi:nitrate/nitrite-specific signal transduction histidine kinase
VNVWRENGELKIQVDDNGIGRQAAEAIKSKINKLHQPSHGMKISAERLSIVNDVYKVNATVQVTDLTDDENKGTGTRVLLTIQYKTNAGNHN